MTIAEWVRHALGAARRLEPVGHVGKKLEAIRTAAKYEFPSGDMQEVLSEIAQGYRGTIDRDSH